MSNLQFPWGIYKEIQTEAARCDRITSRSWGIENGLNKFLAAVSSSSGTTDLQGFQNNVGRAIATGSWVERNRAQLRRKYLRQHPEPDAEQRMLARGRLTETRRAVSAAEWVLLVDLATGIPYHEIAADRGVTVGCLRTRICRLRSRLGKGQERTKPVA